MRILLALLVSASALADEPFVAAPPESVPLYSATDLPCTIDRSGPHPVVACPELAGRTLRELSIMRNVIYARQGWDGYRKPWLREYFHSQKWFKANPKFTYKLLSPVDKKNAHLIAAREQSFTSGDLTRLREDVYARHGKSFADAMPEWTLKNGKSVKSCKKPKNTDDDSYGGDINLDDFAGCRYARASWYKVNPAYSDALLTADDKVELGLISRASGEFSLDDDTRGKAESGLDRLLSMAELRQLSLRDLRLLRNTIYARRGRTFKSDVLRSHFEGLDWYKAAPDYSDKLLTRNDTRNIGMIKSVENEFGGPLTDEDWLTEPATDGA